MQKSLVFAFVVAVVLAVQVQAQYSTSTMALGEGVSDLVLPLLDSTFGASFEEESSVSAMSAREILSAAATNVPCNASTCGEGWVIQTWNGPNCVGSTNNFTLVHALTDPTCTNQDVSRNTSRLLVCDTTLGFFGTWMLTGSATCDESYKDFFAGYRIGSCLNSNITNPSNSNYSVALWCSYKDAIASKPTATTPYTLGATIPTSNPCPNNQTTCDEVPYYQVWEDNGMCMGNSTRVDHPNMTLDTCYSFPIPNSTTNAFINFQLSCRSEGFLLFGIYGRQCQDSAASFIAAYNTKNCLSAQGKSYRYVCRTFAPSSANGLWSGSFPILSLIFIFALALLSLN